MKTLMKEVKFRTSRSSGAGGQHVNKVETKIELLFDVTNSTILTDEQKEQVMNALKNRINKNGILVLSSQASRSQLLNRNKVIKKFERLLEQVFAPKAKRKGPTALVANPRKRLKQKRQHSEKKQNRKKVMQSVYDL